MISGFVGLAKSEEAVNVQNKQLFQDMAESQQKLLIRVINFLFISAISQFKALFAFQDTSNLHGLLIGIQ